MAGVNGPRAFAWRWRKVRGDKSCSARLTWAFLLAAIGLACVTNSDTAQAQTNFLTFKSQIRPTPPASGGGLAKEALNPKAAGVGQSKMLVQADEMDYDYNNHRISAVGNVQIYHNGSTLEADKVIYDQTTKRVHAEGNARLTEANGKVTYGEIIDLSEDFRDGFVDSLRVDTADQTRMAAARADRTEGNFTVLQNGVYTACEPCREDPRKPPLWQVKAARIIHDQTEKMMYFEDASLEFFGKPIAWFPYMSAPDPTVKRKTGFLMPIFSSSSAYGVAVETPYYVALAPDYDLTLSPRMTSKQGPLMQGEFRQRLENGSYTIKAAGLYQLDRNYFIRDDGTPTSGWRDWRGSLETTGKFALSPMWTAGWDGVLVTDPTFFQNYRIRSLQQRTGDPFGYGLTEGISQLYLNGRGDRSFFDIRAIHYTGFSEADVQSALPIIHPVLDYSRTLATPVFGGELGYSVNLTSLSRATADFDPISATAVLNNSCAQTADPAIKTSTNCLLRGIAGDYTRLSAESHWRRQIIDTYGQIWTPFASIRADVANVNIRNDIGVSNFITPGESQISRVMPTVGLEYRYPFISVHSWGTQTVEPIAQVIIRPDEKHNQRLPNEDAQSLVYDDTNLFKVDKFSGWDREEGGGRLNAGAQYTAQFNRYGQFNMLFGQSYQLFGVNSFALGDLTNTGIDSGLDTSRSDYVARAMYQPNKIYSVIARFRFDEKDFTLRRLEVEGRANFDRWNASVLYGNYDAQPELGFLARREGVLGSGSVKVATNWVVTGAARYDIDASKFDQLRFGVGYVDDCFIMSLNYITDYSYNGNVQTNHSILFQVSLRTLGGSGTQ
jgi:LPS-assembly protein